MKWYKSILLSTAISVCGFAGNAGAETEYRTLNERQLRIEVARAQQEERTAKSQAQLAYYALEKYEAEVEPLLLFFKNSDNEDFRLAYAAFIDGDYELTFARLQTVADRESAERVLAGELEADEEFIPNEVQEWSRIGLMAFYADAELSISSYKFVLELEPGNTEALGKLAFLYLRTGQVVERESVIQNLLESPDPEAKTLGLLHHGLWLQQRGFFEEALTSLEEAAEIAESEGLDRVAVQANVLRSANYLARSDLVSAGYLAEESYFRAKNAEYLYELAGSAYQLGIVEQYSGGDMWGRNKQRAQRADMYYVESGSIYEELGATWDLADLTVQRARVRLERDDYQGAFDFATRGLLLAQETENVTAQSFAHQVLGNLHSRSKGDWYADADLAIDHFTKSVDVIKGRGFEHIEAVNLITWAMALERLQMKRFACQVARKSSRLYDTNMQDASPKQLRVVQARENRYCR